MAKITKKCRLCRREKAKLFLKGGRCFSPKCPIEKKGAVPPGIHGLRSGIRPSAYGKQLREKQKVKRIYGLSETQLKNYFLAAGKEKGNVGELLLRLLEMRFDNVFYRLGLAPSRATARQLIGHGQVLINGKKLTIPSYQVKKGDEITLSEKARKMEKIQSWIARKEDVPGWLKKRGFVGKVVSLPEMENIVSEIDESLVVEYYSR